jgi:maltooligosyltrehalose trehalohydrolase
MTITGTIFQSDKRCLFSVWAPEKKSMVLHIVHPVEQELEMSKDEMGYFTLTIDGIDNNCKYFYKTR